MAGANRINKLPPYLFAEIDRKIAAAKAKGVDVISLGIGDPVEPTPSHIVDKLCEEARKQENQRYPSYYGLPQFRQAIAKWYKSRFGVTLEPDKEILPLIGSKEGIAHIFTALVDPGNAALIPDPGYPVYQTGTLLAGGEPYFIPLLEENDFNPNITRLNEDLPENAKLLFLNYPNNPTAAIVNERLFAEAVALGKAKKITICHDFAYSEITYDGYKAPSILETPDAKDTAVEFHSLSKTYNMTGWRCGWVAGCAEIIEALGRVKTNIDSGIFNAIQLAGVTALEGPQDCVEEMRRIYQRRRDMVTDSLTAAGFNVSRPKGSVFIWLPIPEGQTSASFATSVLDKTGVVLSPGSAYGPHGEGYVRISLTVKDDRLEEALDRINRHLC